MIENISKDKFILINEAFQLKEYDTVIQESCKIFEVLMKKLYVESLGRFDSKCRKKLVEAEFSQSTSQDGIDSFSFGKIIGLYRESDFFTLWGEQTGRDPSLLRGINFQLINKLRNASAHNVKGHSSDLQGAEYVYSNLKLFLALLGYTEYEKHISSFLEHKPSDHTSSCVKHETPAVKRRKNVYDVTDQEERQRIGFQAKFCMSADVDIVSKLVKNKTHFHTLDIGCNDGSMTRDRLKNLPNRGLIVGTDINSEIFPETDSKNDVLFLQSDCESDAFEDDVRAVMQSNSIDGFDLVVLSLVLLHLKNPFKVLKSARRLMGRNGSLFIRDVDDGLCLAFPDPKGIIDKILDINFRIKDSGYRHQGREIYSILKKTGFRNIKLYNVSNETIGMGFEEREMFFESEFSYIKGDLLNAANENPEKYSDDLNWLNHAYEELEEQFLSEDFFYQSGDMIFTATKE